MALEDERLLFEWANDPDVRGNSISMAPIPWERHVSWFRGALRRPSTHMFVLTTLNATPVGQIRIDVDEEQVGTINFSVASGSRGRGYGTELIRRGCEQVRASAGVVRFRAVVKLHNVASLRAFERVGFRRVCRTAHEGGGLIELASTLEDTGA